MVPGERSNDSWSTLPSAVSPNPDVRIAIRRTPESANCPTAPITRGFGTARIATSAGVGSWRGVGTVTAPKTGSAAFGLTAMISPPSRPLQRADDRAAKVSWALRGSDHGDAVGIEELRQALGT